MTTTPAAGQSSEHPFSVAVVSRKVSDWIDRLSAVWVEGEITALTVRPGQRWAYLTLRDTSRDAEISAMCAASLIRGHATTLKEGSKVVVCGSFNYYAPRGSLSFRLTEIKEVGIGELLARLERLRALLRAEGLCAPEKKKPLPFLPEKIGLITGRKSAAERDVLAMATQRWPEVTFEIMNTAVQGATAAAEVTTALLTLDTRDDIDVIIIARGGGSVEDLMPFSDEHLCRTIAACSKVIVSAIGHEPDHPISDDVADIRAATPTDAAKTVVPDAQQEREILHELRERASIALSHWVVREHQFLHSLSSRPVMSNPLSMVQSRREELERIDDAALRHVHSLVTTAGHEVSALSARLEALGPQATLKRGYSIVQRLHPGPAVVTETGDVQNGDDIRIRVHDGSFFATVNAEGEEKP